MPLSVLFSGCVTPRIFRLTPRLLLLVVSLLLLLHPTSAVAISGTPPAASAVDSDTPGNRPLGSRGSRSPLLNLKDDEDEDKTLWSQPDVPALRPSNIKNPSSVATTEVVIYLKNGTDLSGKLVRLTDTSYHLQTEVGEIRIPKTQYQGMILNTPEEKAIAQSITTNPFVMISAARYAYQMRYYIQHGLKDVSDTCGLKEYPVAHFHVQRNGTVKNLILLTKSNCPEAERALVWAIQRVKLPALPDDYTMTFLPVNFPYQPDLLPAAGDKTTAPASQIQIPAKLPAKLSGKPSAKQTTKQAGKQPKQPAKPKPTAAAKSSAAKQPVSKPAAVLQQNKAPQKPASKKPVKKPSSKLPTTPANKKPVNKKSPAAKASIN